MINLPGQQMMEEAAQIQEIIDLCMRARNRQGGVLGFRARTLLDMLLLELGEELARAMSDDGRQDDPKN